MCMHKVEKNLPEQNENFYHLIALWLFVIIIVYIH